MSLSSPKTESNQRIACTLHENLGAFKAGMLRWGEAADGDGAGTQARDTGAEYKEKTAMSGHGCFLVSGDSWVLPDPGFYKRDGEVASRAGQIVPINPELLYLTIRQEPSD